MDPEDELTRLNYGPRSSDRKRRLLRCASLRSVQPALSCGPVAEVVEACAGFAEWWMNADLEDTGLDERTRLIRAYDRRQQRAPLLTRLEAVQAAEFKGAPTTDRRLFAYRVLRAADALLCDESSWDRIYHAEQCEKLVVSLTQKLTLAWDIFGSPLGLPEFSPAWTNPTTFALAKHIYDARDFSAMPILADALQDAGCDNVDILAHCRDANQVHVCGCWVVDLVLGKG